MTVTDIQRDTEALTLTITADFDAPVSRVWQLWADPRLLERWWGPPTYPATVVDHEFVPDGRVTYFMTGPEGQKHHGWWRVIAVEPPHALEFEDGFADDSGEPNPELPTTVARVTITDQPTGARMVLASTFTSLEAMEQMIAMGVEEGMAAALGQADALLAT